MSAFSEGVRLQRHDLPDLPRYPILQPQVLTKGVFYSGPSERVSFMPSPGELKIGHRQPASGAELDSGIGTNRLSTYDAASPR